jgi:large subunit ribosomal protein L21
MFQVKSLRRLEFHCEILSIPWLTLAVCFGLIALLCLIGINMYAVIETGGKQYTVQEGDQLKVEKLGVESGQTVTFDRVMLVSDNGDVKIGTPVVESATVVAEVKDHFKAPKIVIYKMKRRKGYRLKAGHRQKHSLVEIKEIKLS